MGSSSDLKTDNYILSTGSAIDGLRVLIEGAIHLYTEETDPIFRLALANDHYQAAQTFSTIGEALYLLQSHIRDMQAAYIEEFQRQMKEDSTP